MSRCYAALSLVLVVVSTLATPVSLRADEKRLVVNLNRQKLFAFDGAKEVYAFDCITGKAGKETTPGRFRIWEKTKDYESRTYKVPMPYSLFFTDDRKAIHQTPFAKLRSYAKYLGLDQPGSHGCVGLSEDDAKAIYDWAPLQTTVDVVEGALDGTWKSNDAGKRFSLEVSGKSVTWTERRPSGAALQRKVTLEEQEGGAAFRASRDNDDEVLTFLEFTSSDLRREIIAQRPEPSFLVLRRQGNRLSGRWYGLLVRKQANGHLKEIVQPSKMTPADFTFELQ